MAKSKRKNVARPTNKRTHVITLQMDRAIMELLAEIAKIGGVTLDQVCAVILASGVIRERGKLPAARKRP